MSYPNEHIPQRSHVRERLAIRLIEVERDFWRDHAEELLKRLENIPLAVEQHGFINISEGRGTVKLVAAPVEEPQE